MSLNRGLRNNNPGNIEDGIAWDGLANYDDDERFCEFVSPEMGIRAMCKILLTYDKKYGIDTVAEIITRWAPPIENDTENYIKNVCNWTGFDRDYEFEHNVANLSRLTMAMARMENGTAHWSTNVYAYGAHLALE